MKTYELSKKIESCAFSHSNYLKVSCRFDVNFVGFLFADFISFLYL